MMNEKKSEPFKAMKRSETDPGTTSKEERLVDSDRLNSLIDLLRNTRKIEWGGGDVIGKAEDGKDILQWPFPIYPDGLYESLYELAVPDRNYIENYERLGDPIDYGNLTMEESRTVITHYVRGERFCDGLIAGAVEDGTLLKVAERMKEICDRNGSEN